MSYLEANGCNSPGPYCGIRNEKQQYERTQSMSPLNREPLIHIGYHKTGSSWLQRYLFPEKEQGFETPFLREDEIGELLIYPNALDFSECVCREAFYSKIKGSLQKGLVPVLSYERLSGNPHSGGYDSCEIADRLHRVFPQAKILMVIREQSGMILSTYKQYIVEGGSCSLLRYLYPTSQGKGRIPLFSFNHFKYHRLVSYYMSLFGEKKVLVLPYELFTRSPMEFLMKLRNYSLARCNYSIKGDPPFKDRMNVSLSWLSLTIKKILNPIFTDDRLNPQAIFPSMRIERQIIWCLNRFDEHLPGMLRQLGDKKMKERISDIIGKQYRESNRITSTLIGDDLQKYGYEI